MSKICLLILHLLNNNLYLCPPPLFFFCCSVEIISVIYILIREKIFIMFGLLSLWRKVKVVSHSPCYCLCRVFQVPCLCGFYPGTKVSFYFPKTCQMVDWPFLIASRCVWVCVQGVFLLCALFFWHRLLIHIDPKQNKVFPEVV